VTRRGHAQELQKIVSQTNDLRDGLINLTKKLPEFGAGQDREIAEDLTTLHHQLSDLRAHVDIARREVVLAKRLGFPEKGMGRNGSRHRPVDRLIRGMSTGKNRGNERFRPVMGSPRERNGTEGNWISTELSRKKHLVMKRKRPKLMVSIRRISLKIALEKCAQRRRDQLDIAAGAEVTTLIGA